MEVDQSSVMFFIYAVCAYMRGFNKKSECPRVNALTFWPFFRAAKFQAIV